MKKNRIVVVAGGEISPSDLKQLTQWDRIFGVDGGILTLLKHGLTPDCAVGDFDTAGPDTLSFLKSREIPVENLPVAKDMTDTQFALEKALHEQPKEILILGALGGARFDHALANLFLLEKAAAAGVPCTLLHRNNRIRLLTGGEGEMVLQSRGYQYISLLALTERVEGVTLTGFRYPLQNAVLTRSNPLGISNELLTKAARIQIQSGKLLIMESRDEPSQ
ncbi:thiamine diphosphokinase [Kroppenstedtia pulmonis]|uniref:Thiamine diphosphokinase n=1 Tax=Kroppenstedtia pulmonis TaxID=1380685 RepID=A0A7D3XS02_9BACL|nr:thiamine diphosphokinase [Kroppenstedtia pulmonis]QKG84668.1 thiamine diphosphokinase [Kroppenstedtia pulmonis]